MNQRTLHSSLSGCSAHAAAGPHLCKGDLPSLAHVVLQVLPGGCGRQARHDHTEGGVVGPGVGAPAVVPACSGER